MGKIRVILWDIDGTLLDFYEAQKNAIRACFESHNLGKCSDEMLDVYDEINHQYWYRLEKGELNKSQVLTGRFYEFFEKYSLDKNVVEAFNDEYQLRLGDTICFYDKAFETLKKCKELGIIQFAVTNGTKVAQEKKLNKSGLIELFDDVFISDDIGFEKPSIEFFEKVINRANELCDNLKRNEIMIVGDSMTSDMQGGINIGIVTCFFKHDRQPKNASVPVDYEVDKIFDVLKYI